ncbi:competence type IV pilus minor pilin ComGD [Listeria welshimeri]|uniref:competence type IV pilus minor pilin ComGD n=1 Tax=Listeria welshimeri TaxID=1643 RepID=UPI0016268C9A|nr:competence type IV pilus minor pilin ComGD [Listeria welshimeri]MBC1632225.1 type II secretion system protein [Listeria welshimeri]MBC1958988.1 type II secretion system protein [Listeria welshimeri]MBF2386676.1 type II secretion system protein [Listeria welshimeri]
MKNNAFTLLEMLLVLSISLTMITLTIYPISTTLSSLTEKQLLEEVKAAIYFAQLNAITTSNDTVISFQPEINHFSSSTATSALTNIQFDNSLKINHIKPEKFRFSGLDGSINRFATVHFSGKKQTYKLIFQIGKGRFRIEAN